MITPALLVSQLRTQSKLSQRALAELTGCTRSTIARIEKGEMDPTITMLARIAAAGGHRLTFDSTRPLPRESIATIARNMLDVDPSDVPWTQLRALLDWLRLNPDKAIDIIADPPPRTNPNLDNLLAAIANKVADDHHHRRPSWTADVPIPAITWHAPGTPRMCAKEKASAPEQFLERGIFLSATNLWRTNA
jgi:transcriptional regulator with XRE-family HTH domain